MNAQTDPRRLRGVVFGIQFFSIHDGPGIRTAVFLKGCDLHCAWCHNPESLDRRAQISVSEKDCVGCGLCAAACPRGLHRVNAQGVFHARDASRCLGCGACEEACPAGAIRVMGRRMSVEEVLAQAERDRKFYGDDGGITVTGGEPTAQFDFLLALCREAANRGLRVCIETNGTASAGQYAALLPYLQCVMVDYKLTDGEAHRRLTGAGNERILQNIAFLSEHCPETVLRCPIIPTVNDNDEHFAGIARMTVAHPRIRGAEIMPYHRFGTAKARQIGWDEAEIRRFPVPTSEQVQAWKERIAAFGGRLI